VLKVHWGCRQNFRINKERRLIDILHRQFSWWKADYFAVEIFIVIDFTFRSLILFRFFNRVIGKRILFANSCRVNLFFIDGSFLRCFLNLFNLALFQILVVFINHFKLWSKYLDLWRKFLHQIFDNLRLYYLILALTSLHSELHLVLFLLDQALKSVLDLDLGPLIPALLGYLAPLVPSKMLSALKQPEILLDCPLGTDLGWIQGVEPALTALLSVPNGAALAHFFIEELCNTIPLFSAFLLNELS